MKIYTRRGDDGSTGLFGGPRVGKDDLRVCAYGDVDELNSVLGLARVDCTDRELAAILDRLQSELFTLGAQLATPDPDHPPRGIPPLTDADIAQMEHEIDRFDEELPPLQTFILPGGTRCAAYLHLARTVCRRAERSSVGLARHERLAPETVRYINRLSDLLFTLARVANHRADVVEAPWKPSSRKEG